MKEVTLVYTQLDDSPTVPGILMDGGHAMHYENGQLWLCTVKMCDIPTSGYEVSDYIGLTRRSVDMEGLFDHLRKIDALTFITSYLFRELAELEMFPV